jgi:hypothetical protein
MTLPERSATAIEDYVAAEPQGGYGAHHYSFKDHGLNEQQERAKFRPYMVRFGVAVEAMVKRGNAPVPETVPSNDEKSLQN